MNEINTWQQGALIADNAGGEKHHLVRSDETVNAICRCEKPNDAKWIASRLNLASTLEQLVYDYATGKSDGKEMVDLVKNAAG